MELLTSTNKAFCIQWTACRTRKSKRYQYASFQISNMDLNLLIDRSNLGTETASNDNRVLNYPFVDVLSNINVADSSHQYMKSSRGPDSTISNNSIWKSKCCQKIAGTLLLWKDLIVSIKVPWLPMEGKPEHFQKKTQLHAFGKSKTTRTVRQRAKHISFQKYKLIWLA